ncbi:acyl-CoA thioester hydrolase [Chryseolinea serpens]|uniref:Acyl-CoA thioester hydrolase n=1 Tax=Chryseolinea serpens TaxID=947013 RepID=A0A1M5QIC2_9BACT|nr:acyl-CoA thioester hydrolase [Chryseolinea serpens]
MLIHQTEILVRFNEADPLGIVWHGHYLRYFEDGREAFGKVHGISYLDFYRNGLAVPVVSVNCDYKKPLRYGDSVIVETIYMPSPAAKLHFEYRMFDSTHRNLVATGASTQVFVDAKSFELQFTTPAFFEAWKSKQNFNA